jgi:hypothetical protein
VLVKKRRENHLVTEAHAVPSLFDLREHVRLCRSKILTGYDAIYLLTNPTVLKSKSQEKMAVFIYGEYVIEFRRIW